MKDWFSAERLTMTGLLAAAILLPSFASAQDAKPINKPAPAPRVPPAPTVTVVAGPGFDGTGPRRWLMGDMYRDLWTTPIEVPVLDVKTYAGGLKPTKRGGGMQTKTLRLEDKNGLEYSFRTILKDHAWTIPEGLEGTIVARMSRDQRASTHPAGAAVVAPLFEAAGVITPQPTMVVLPKDVDLGEFTKDFAGSLGWIEPFPNKPDSAPGFLGDSPIIDSEKLLEKMNEDPTERVDAHVFLTARLMDMLVGDWDRHPGQWRWAKVGKGNDARWLAIPRDHDMAFVMYDGLIGKIGGMIYPFFTPFSSQSGNENGLIWDSLEMDRRLLSSLEKPAWDSVVAEVTRRVTDQVIDGAVARMPLPYQAKQTSFASTLKARRARLPQLANAAYARLNEHADIHASDAKDRAVITQLPGGAVDVRLETEKGLTVFTRRYHARETKEIRVYLHGGDDIAVVRGNVRSIPVRVIGGNGNNTLADSTGVRGAVRMYDLGETKGAKYGKDTLFNRQHWEEEEGKPAPPALDRGASTSWGLGISNARGLGWTPSVSVTRTVLGFEKRPYASELSLKASYAFKVGDWRLVAEADKRLEGSPLHFTAMGRASWLEMLNYHGLGNTSPDSGVDNTYFRTRQRLLTFAPAMALALGEKSDLSLGPIVQHSRMDDNVGRFVAAAQPYGSGSFGQLGVQALLHHEGAIGNPKPKHRYIVDLSGAAFPAVWDVTSAFQSVGLAVEGQATLPIPTNPIFAMRAGGKKVFGNFPFHEAAFLGGNHTARYMEPQRFAGDASLYGSVELRVPFSSFTAALPFDWGVLGLGDVGRVYVDGASPGGWHSVTGYGLWFGLRGNHLKVVTLTMVSEVGRTGLHLRTGLGF
jgi:hypothetical protein